MTLLREKERDFLWRIAGRIVPETVNCGEEEREEILRIIEEAIAQKGKGTVRQFRLFLRALKLLIRLRPGKEVEILRSLQNGPIPILRKGFWGLKTLIFLGYYGRGEIGPLIHYQPSFRGNECLSKKSMTS